MEEKKIATSVDLLINIDRFEHLQITKYAEKKITYTSNEEMLQKEDELTNQLIDDVKRSLRIIPEKMKQIPGVINKMEAVEKIEDKIIKKMPAWLEEERIPNIANSAKKQSDNSKTTAYSNAEDKKEQNIKRQEETDAYLEGKSDEKTNNQPEESNNDEDLFDDKDLFEGM